VYDNTILAVIYFDPKSKCSNKSLAMSFDEAINLNPRPSSCRKARKDSSVCVFFPRRRCLQVSITKNLHLCVHFSIGFAGQSKLRELMERWNIPVEVQTSNGNATDLHPIICYNDFRDIRRSRLSHNHQMCLKAIEKNCS